MKLFRVSQKAFVRNQNGHVLFVRFSSDLHDPELRDLWDIPGGGVEFGEDLDAAFHREVNEEIGVSVEKGSLITVWDWLATPVPIPGKTYKSPDEHEYHGIILGFDAMYREGTIVLHEEHGVFKWIDPHDWHRFNTGFEKEKIRRIWTEYLQWYEHNV